MKIISTFLIFVFSQTCFAAFTLLWMPAEGDVDGYHVEESTDNGNSWSLSKTLVAPSPNPDGYIEASIDEPNILTIYRIKAFNASGTTILENLLVGHNPAASGSLPVWDAQAAIGSRPQN